MTQKTKNKPNLTSNNYHSLEMDRHYMSVSLLKEFAECEARAMAYLDGKYKKQVTAAMLVGSYTHAAFESDEVFKRFNEENKSSIINTRGNKYAPYKQADLMIESIKNDEFAMFAMKGDKEQIYT